MFALKTKILVMDDMLTMRKFICKTLKEIGFTSVEEADDGSTGLPKIEAALNSAEPFQLIISDWSMPNIKGIDVLRKVRSIPQIANTPFILVTAESDKEQIIEAVSLKVSGYIVKPFKKEDLVNKLTEVAAAAKVSNA